MTFPAISVLEVPCGQSDAIPALVFEQTGRHRRARKPPKIGLFCRMTIWIAEKIQPSARFPQALQKCSRARPGEVLLNQEVGQYLRVQVVPPSTEMKIVLQK